MVGEVFNLAGPLLDNMKGAVLGSRLCYIKEYSTPLTNQNQRNF